MAGAAAKRFLPVEVVREFLCFIGVFLRFDYLGNDHGIAAEDASHGVARTLIFAHHLGNDVLCTCYGILHTAYIRAIDKALEFDDMKEKSKALLFRGVILKCMEREDEAKKEFNRVLKMAEEGEEVEERDIMLVNAYLGNSEQVEEIIGKSDTDDNDDLRAMAQTRAIQGQYDKALLYLELLKENGYPHYKSLGRDPVFQPMKDMADYQQLMAAWKAVVGE